MTSPPLLCKNAHILIGTTAAGHSNEQQRIRVYHKEQLDKLDKIGEVLISAIENDYATFEVCDDARGVQITYNGVTWIMRKMWDSSVFAEVKMENGMDELVLLTKKHSDCISSIIRDKMCETPIHSL